MTSRPPFQSARQLPADLAITFYLMSGALVGIAWDYTRPRLSHALVTLGARLA